MLKGVRKVRDTCWSAPQGTPRGPLSGGLASWEFASLRLLLIYHSTQCSVRSAKLGLQAKGKTEREMQECYIAVA